MSKKKLLSAAPRKSNLLFGPCHHETVPCSNASSSLHSYIKCLGITVKLQASIKLGVSKRIRPISFVARKVLTVSICRELVSFP